MTYPPESCKDNPYEVLTTTCKPEPIDTGTISPVIQQADQGGSILWPLPSWGGTQPYYAGTALHPTQFPTCADYKQRIDDDLKTNAEYQAIARQREQERYERYLATRTRGQAFRDGVRAQRRLLRNALYGFAIAVFGACFVGGLVLTALALSRFFTEVLAGNWAAIALTVIGIAFIALIVAVHIDDGKDY